MSVHIPADALAEYGDLHRALQRILDAVEATYAAAGVSLPDRRFTAVGDVASAVAADCEQVTVNFIQLYQGPPGQPNLEPKGCMEAMAADFVVQVTRCVPTVPVSATSARASRRAPISSAPDVVDIEAATLIQAVDAQMLFEMAYSLSSLTGNSATVEATGVEGGMQSVALNLSTSLFEM